MPPGDVHWCRWILVGVRGEAMRAFQHFFVYTRLFLYPESAKEKVEIREGEISYVVRRRGKIYSDVDIGCGSKGGKHGS
ncbi:MAG: hypothetical protein NVS4B11_27190 [Ktedonobacteraceae bacterium]